MARIDDLENMMRQVTKAAQKPIRPDAASMAVMQAESLMQVNSAMQAAQISQELDDQFEEIAERNERRDAAIQRTAQESVEHTRLLEKQLQEVQAQNEMLKAEAADLRKEREENKKAAKKARRLNIAAFVLSIVLPVVSIVASILIAKFM